MSFIAMKRDELVDVAEKYGVDLDTDATRASIIKSLADNGVKYDDYKKQFGGGAEEKFEAPNLEPEETFVEEEPAEEEALVLVKMTRLNGTFQARGYKFSRVHPYALVKESDADALVEKIGGFKIATPKEAKEFYS